MNLIDNYKNDEINKELWNICRNFKLQTNFDTNYMDYISALLYITYYNDDNHRTLNELYSIRKNYYIGEEIDEKLKNILNYKDRDLFSNIRFKEIKAHRNIGEENILSNVINRIYNLVKETENKYNESQKYILEAYKYAIIQYMSNNIKLRGGESYTPTGIAKVMVECLQIDDEYKTIIDPYCGTGNILLNIPNYKNLELYGREENINAYNLCKTVLLLSEKNNENIKLNNLEEKENFNKKFDYIISNPPFLERELERRMIRNRKLREYYGISNLAPGDYSYIFNMFERLTPNGKMAVILPHGVLFRESEKVAREYLIKNNIVDAVIGLPENIFFGTKISVIIMILSKNKKDSNILFIDASKDFLNKKKINILENKEQQKIISTYINRKDVAGYCKNISINKIIENDYNLSIKKYVKKEVKKQKIKKDELIKDLEMLEREKNILEENIKDVLEKLEIEDVLKTYETTVTYSEVDYIRIGENIRKARIKKGYTCEEVCEKLQITPHFLLRIEYGRSRITLDRIVEICKVLDVSVEELVGTEEKIEDNIFYLKNNGIEYAKGKFTNKGFVILKGSKIKNGIYESLSKSLVNFVERERKSNCIQDGKFINDYLCTTPTMAAVLILGRNSNGYTEWKNKAGKTLGDIIRA